MRGEKSSESNARLGALREMCRKLVVENGGEGKGEILTRVEQKSERFGEPINRAGTANRNRFCETIPEIDLETN